MTQNASIVNLLIISITVSTNFALRQTTSQKNVFGDDLEICSTDPMTGWFRNGKCTTARNDYGSHVTCAEMTQEFLDYTRLQGNDLSTARGSFPGLRAGDKWCLCAVRWKQAMEATLSSENVDNINYVPMIQFNATHQKMVGGNFGMKYEQIKRYALP